jgi:Uma2 family endonuclease
MTVAAKAPNPDRALDGIPPDTRVVIAGVPWEFYASLVGAVREGASCRIAFDGTDIELMTVGPFHDLLKSYIDAFVAIVAEELAIDCQSVGSTIWKRKKIKRGVESDLCYYFDPAKFTACSSSAARRSNSVKDYPNPDLAVEIDLSPSKIDRPGIYAALNVPEFWRVRRGSVSIERLVTPGTYIAAEKSQFLPAAPEDVARWIWDEEEPGRPAWKRRLRDWAREELV